MYILIQRFQLRQRLQQLHPSHTIGPHIAPSLDYIERKVNAHKIFHTSSTLFDSSSSYSFLFPMCIYITFSFVSFSPTEKLNSLNEVVIDTEFGEWYNSHHGGNRNYDEDGLTSSATKSHGFKGSYYYSFLIISVLFFRLHQSKYIIGNL